MTGEVLGDADPLGSGPVVPPRPDRGPLGWWTPAAVLLFLAQAAEVVAAWYDEYHLDFRAENTTVEHVMSITQTLMYVGTLLLLVQVALVASARRRGDRAVAATLAALSALKITGAGVLYLVASLSDDRTDPVFFPWSARATVGGVAVAAAVLGAIAVHLARAGSEE